MYSLDFFVFYFKGLSDTRDVWVLVINMIRIYDMTYQKALLKASLYLLREWLQKKKLKRVTKGYT